MFPIRDDNPQLYTPVTTYALILLNVLAWFTVQGLGTSPALDASVCTFGLIPGELFGHIHNSQHAMCPQNSLGWIGIVTAMFMHGSWMHIIGNMWFLWVFGGNVEDSMGSLRFLIFYLVTGIFAATAQILADPSSLIPMVGASGAIGGVMGAYIMLYPKVKVHMLVILFVIITRFKVPAVAMLGYWILVQVIGGLNSTGAEGGGVAFWAHVGGFVAGAIFVFLFKSKTLLDKHPYHGW